MADDLGCEDEDVIFENSPLEQYLKDAGVVDFEPECVRKQNECLITNQDGEKTLQKSEFNWFRNHAQCFVNHLFSLHDIDKELTFRKEYVSTVFSSGIMSEDDIGFLQQFDPELFDSDETFVDFTPKQHNFPTKLFNHVLSNVDAGYVGNLAVLVLILAITLSANYYKHFNGILVAGIVLVVYFTCCYFWKRQKLYRIHSQNMTILNDYLNDLKSFLTTFRKGILLIQELELISKGYTFVGLGLQLRSQENEESGSYHKDIYPMLRKCLLEQGMALLLPSCLFVKNIVLLNPLATEVNNVFTYISTNPSIEFGLDEYTETEKLSLQYLKLLLSVIASQQSELLSRYLLCLSKKAKAPTKPCAFSLKELASLHQGFYNQWNITDSALKSLKLSYHVHKSSLTFAGSSDLKQDTDRVAQRPQSKWSRYYTAIHSLELHLKACLTRTQAVTDFLISEMQAERDTLALDKNKAERNDLVSEEATCEGEWKDNTLGKLESANVSLKMELGSTISCLEECVNSLKIIHGVDETNSQEMEPESSDNSPVENSMLNSSDYPCDERHEILGDCVFEAYTDIIDEDDIHSPLLTREELEKEARSREESKHLLLELKNVLLTKTKDPLITEAGFVEPIKKQSEQNSHEELSIKDADAKTKLDDKLNSNDFKIAKAVMPPKLPSAQNDNSTEMTAPFPSKAFSFAIQAAALSRGPIMEESYGSSDSSENSDTE